MLAAILHKYPYGGSARLDQHLAPAICLLMGNGIAWLTDRFTPPSSVPHQGTLVVLVLLTAFGAVGLIRDIIRPYKTTAEVWNRSFVHELIERLEPGDRVVILHGRTGLRPGLEWYFRQHDDRVRWSVELDVPLPASGKVWCVRFGPDAADFLAAAVANSGQRLVPLTHYQSIAPPEHGDEPEIAEVACFGQP